MDKEIKQSPLENDVFGEPPSFEDASLLSTYNKYKQDLLEQIKKTNPRSHYVRTRGKTIDSGVRDAVKAREAIENDDLEQNIRLKKHTLYALFGFLAIETLIIFLFSFFQATFTFNFKLEEWSFKLLVTATILQITFMIQVAVKHLFPNKK